jgi:hypothetical protein
MRGRIEGFLSFGFAAATASRASEREEGEGTESREDGGEDDEYSNGSGVALPRGRPEPSAPQVGGPRPSDGLAAV